MTNLRECLYCNKKLPLMEFYVSRGRPHGHKCKTCTKANTADYARKINPSTGLSNRQIWYRKYHKSNLERMSRYRKYVRNEVISYYSKGAMSCECCNESEPKFLAIDHIIPAGRSYKGKTKTGIPRDGLGLWSWLKQHNFPEGYRVLCHNCNLGRSLNNGICPHKLLEDSDGL